MTTQRATVLTLLEEAGPAGVSAHDLIYRHGITRGAAIVHELRRQGWRIRTIDEGSTPDGREKLARYVLAAQPRSAMERCQCTHTAAGHQGVDGACVGRYLGAACECKKFEATA